MDSVPARNENLISSESWDRNWENTGRIRPIRPWRSYFDWLYVRLLKKYISSGTRVLEVGCGGSQWLPYFAKQLKAEAWGIDFSPAGVRSAKTTLQSVGCSARIIEADLFEENALPFEYFDVVWSSGFIEHFTDTAATIHRMTYYAKPRGLVITSVPNLFGVSGWINRFLDRKRYDSHIQFTPQSLDESHKKAGLSAVQSGEWFGSFPIPVLYLSTLLKDFPKPIERLAWRGLETVQILVTAPLWLTGSRLESQIFSSWVVGVYRRP